MEERGSEESVLYVQSWRQKISSKMKAINRYSPDMFLKSQWQTRPGISMYYLVYRWVMAILLFIILLSSLVDLGRPKKPWNYYVHWPIYLSHWGVSICSFQALLAAYLVTSAYCKLSGEEVEIIKMNCNLQVYWLFHTIATTGAFCVTAIYWSAVYDPVLYPIDVLAVFVHILNSILMFIDLVVIAHPIRIIDFYWPVFYGIIYCIFDFLYFLAGGNDSIGRPYIYKILNWQNPIRTLIVMLTCTLLVLFVHIAVSFFCLFKLKIGQILGRPKARRRESTNDTTNSGIV